MRVGAAVFRLALLTLSCKRVSGYKLIASQNRLAVFDVSHSQGITDLLNVSSQLVKSITTLAILHPAGLFCQERLISLEIALPCITLKYQSGLSRLASNLDPDGGNRRSRRKQEQRNWFCVRLRNRFHRPTARRRRLADRRLGGSCRIRSSRPNCLRPHASQISGRAHVRI